MTTTNTYGRQVVVPLTNKSGGGVIAGDVVVVDTSNNDAFTTSTSGAFTGTVGIAQETIASNAVGRVLTSGYAALVNTSASVTRGNFGKTHTVAKQAVDAGASRGAGTFCQFLTGGTTPDAIVFAPDLAAAAGNVAADAIWDAAGDLAQGTGADTAAKLSAGTAGYFLRSAGAAAALAWNEGPAGTILGETVQTAGDQTITSATMVDLPTNVAVTFTAPSTGNVDVELTATCHANGAASAFMSWGVREASSVIAGASGTSIVARQPNEVTSIYFAPTKRFRITGLTPGNSYTYKWAASNSTTGGVLSASANSPAIMRVVKAP